MYVSYKNHKLAKIQNTQPISMYSTCNYLPFPDLQIKNNIITMSNIAMIDANSGVLCDSKIFILL